MNPEELVSQFGGGIALVVLAAQIVGRSIPDNATGPLGVIRKIAKLIGLYVTPDVDASRQTAEYANETANKALAKVLQTDRTNQRAGIGKAKAPTPTEVK